MTSAFRRTTPRSLLLATLLASLFGCAKEVRTLDAGPPLTPPLAANDPRVPRYQDNAYEVSQGGRYFTWYGCGGCHSLGTKTAPDFTAGRWRNGGDFDQVYRFIDHGHPGVQASYGASIPVEQMWQITAYVRDLARQPAEKRHRQDNDQQGEPRGRTWTGAVR